MGLLNRLAETAAQGPDPEDVHIPFALPLASGITIKSVYRRRGARVS
jgi:hypothetical protein